MSEIQFSENAPRVRKDFSKIPRILEIPNLIEIQKESFERFLQTRIELEKRENAGLQAVFNSVFPIKDFNDTASLEFVGYTLEEPKYDVQECLQRGMTYAAPFKVTIRLVAWDDSEGSQTIRDVKEQEVYFGEIPIMTDNGTFIINGTERVIVSQLHRSPGIFFDTSTSSTVSAAGKKIYSCRIIPYRGSWLDLEFDHKDLLYARIDRRRKILVTVLLKALGYTAEDLLTYFYAPETIRSDGKKFMKKVRPREPDRPALHPRGEGRRRQRAGAQGPQVHQRRGAQAARGRHGLDPGRARGHHPRRQRAPRGARRHRRRAHRRGDRRVQRGDHRAPPRGAEDARHRGVPAALPRPARARARRCATRCSRTRPSPARRRSSTSTAACAPATRRPSTRRPTCSTTCSSTPSATTCRASAG